MLHRFKHAGIALAIVLAIYQLVVLAEVAFLAQPQACKMSDLDSADRPRRQVGRMTPKVRKLLAAYFPEDHWSLREAPTIFQSDRVLVVLDDYHPQADGQILVDRCAMLFFQKPYLSGNPPPRDAILLEAPHGAAVQMDTGQHGGTATSPQLLWGGEVQRAKLRGEVIIRSDMREPGAHDDLLLVTRDLVMTGQMIRTDAAVEMHLGPHRGHGRELEIHLMPDDGSGSGNLSFGGIDLLELTRDVKVKIVPGQDGLFGVPKTDQSPQTTDEPSAGRKEEAASVASPIRVECHGPFKFDFTSLIASFVDQVQIKQIHPDGTQDSTLGVHRLEIYFALDSRKMARGGTQQIPSQSDVAPGSGIRPASVMIQGEAMKIEIPSRRMAAQCDQIWMEMDSNRIRFKSQDEVALHYHGSEIHAPLILYQHPPDGSLQRLGTMLAAGSGWLHAIADPEKPKEPFELSWTESMHLGRRDGKSVVRVEGRSWLRMVGLGRLWANHLELLLRGREQSSKPGEGPLPADVVPDRMLAQGQVAIDSADLQVRVHQMDVQIDYLSEGQQQKDQPLDNTSQLVEGSGQEKLPQEKRRSLADMIRSRGPGRGRRYGIAGNRLQLQLVVREKRPEVQGIYIDGKVVFQELPLQTDALSADQSQPMVIRADHLQVEHADTRSAQIEVRGLPTVGNRPAVDARVSVRGMTLRAPTLHLNRGTSRAWIDSPGELEMLVDRDLQGNALAAGQPLKIVWQQSMELDQDQITFKKDVVVRGTSERLSTEQLIATLSEPVLFDGAANRSQSELEQIRCLGSVTVEFQQTDAGGTTSRQQFQMQTLMVNQKTGQLQGDGPGWLESVHLMTGKGMAGRGPFASREESHRRSSKRAGRLRFLRIDFQRQMEGHLQHRSVEVYGNVKTIYGPVDSWNGRLHRSLSDGPGKDTIWLSSDSLRVDENPVPSTGGESHGMGSMELLAQGHVLIEGSDPDRGAFTANATRATYDQLKTLFVLHGGPSEDATLTHQQFAGGPPSKSSARKISYWQTTGDVKIEGVNKIEWSQFDLGRGKEPGTRR